MSEYRSSETIQYNTLKIFENMLIMNNQTKKELLNLEVDKKIEKLLLISDG